MAALKRRVDHGGVLRDFVDLVGGEETDTKCGVGDCSSRLAGHTLQPSEPVIKMRTLKPDPIETDFNNCQSAK